MNLYTIILQSQVTSYVGYNSDFPGIKHYMSSFSVVVNVQQHWYSVWKDRLLEHDLVG